jgi:DUF1680 family protein
MGGFAYGVSGEKVYVNLFTQGAADIGTEKGKITIAQTTDYPWSGTVKIEVGLEKPADLTRMVRIPGWAQGRPVPSDLYGYADTTRPAWSVRVAGQLVVPALESGYAVLTRECTTIASEALAAEALRLMESKSINGLLVVDAAGFPVGALNMHDLLRAGVM